MESETEGIFCPAVLRHELEMTGVEMTPATDLVCVAGKWARKATHSKRYFSLLSGRQLCVPAWAILL